MRGFLCMARVYEFAGYRFEFGGYVGPWPVDENGEPGDWEQVQDDNAFWEAMERFAGLTDEERAAHCVVSGGCVTMDSGGGSDGTEAG